jgi:hypothetical protein
MAIPKNALKDIKFADNACLFNCKFFDCYDYGYWCCSLTGKLIECKLVKNSNCEYYDRTKECVQYIKQQELAREAGNYLFKMVKTNGKYCDFSCTFISNCSEYGEEEPQNWNECNLFFEDSDPQVLDYESVPITDPLFGQTIRCKQCKKFFKDDIKP